MAKLVIALCILVAVCGAEANLAAGFLSLVVKAVQSLLRFQQEHGKELEIALQNATKSAAEFEANLNSTMLRLIAELSNDVTTCESSRVEILARAYAIHTNATTCLKSSTEEWTSLSSVTGSALDKFKTDLYGFREQAKNCSTKGWSELACFGSMVKEAIVGIGGTWKNLATNATIIINQIGSGATKLATSCNYKAAISDLQTVVEEAKECITALKTNSS